MQQTVDLWKAKQPDLPLSYTIDLNNHIINFTYNNEIHFLLSYPSSTDESFLIHTGKDGPDWANDINEFIFSKDKVTFEEIMYKIVTLISTLKRRLETSVDDPIIDDEDELDAFDSKEWNIRNPEFSKSIEMDVKKCNESFGLGSARFYGDNGTVSITILLKEIISDALASSLDLKRDEPLVITVDFSSCYLQSRVPKPKFSLAQRNNKSNHLKKNLIKELVNMYVDKHWGSKSIRISHENIENKKQKTVNEESLSQLMEMGFDHTLCKAALEELNGDVQRCLDALLNQSFFLTDDLRICMEMGFGYLESQNAIVQFGGNIEKVFDHLFNKNATDKLLSEVKQDNFTFLQGLMADIYYKLAHYKDYCCICNVRHSCNRMSEKPVICSTPLCMFKYEELGMGIKFDNIHLCPFTLCPAEYDPNDEVMSALTGSEATKEMTLDTILNMYKSKYSFPKYLPHDQMMKFVEEGLVQNNAKIKSITSVLQPDKVFRFEAKWEKLRKLRGSEAKPEIAYHGTNPKNINSIIKRGLLVPGNSTGVKHATDAGYWGGGIYLSPNPATSVGYCRGGNKLLICSVVRGRPFKCTQMITGAPLQQGYDSHTDPSGNNEWIIFDSDQVLVCYIVEFTF